MFDIQLVDVTYDSPEFDAAYDVIGLDIPPEYLETHDFLRNRLRVRDAGPASEKEKILQQEGYTLHLIVARSNGQVVGAIYGHLISQIGAGNHGIAFVTYLSVLREYRRRGIGTALIEELLERANEDSLRRTGQPVFGMVYEIEEEGKEEIKAAVGRLGAKPLDIVYHQPALRKGYGPERMNLWFQPVPALAPDESAHFALSVSVVRDIVRNMLTMEYVGPDMSGFDLLSKPYTDFQDSIKGRRSIGFQM